MGSFRRPFAALSRFFVVLVAAVLLALSACGGGGGGSNNPGTNPPGTNPPGTNPPGTNPVPTSPGAPTIGVATAGVESATVYFTAPASDGGSPITGYSVYATPNIIPVGGGSASPVTVTGLDYRAAYTFTVRASNALGLSEASSASNSVTPAPPPFPVDGAVWNMIRVGADYYFSVEKNNSVFIAKYDAGGNRTWENPLLQAVAATDFHYCNKLLAPSSDATHFYAICTKVDLQAFDPFPRSDSGEVRLLKISKDDGTIADSKIIVTFAILNGVEMYPGDNFFYLLAADTTSQALLKFDFSGNFLAAPPIPNPPLELVMTSLQVGADAVYTGGTITQLGTLNRLSVAKFPKDLSSVTETHYRNFNDSSGLDTSFGVKNLTLSSSGLFMTGILDVFEATQKSVLLRWDPVTGIATLVKSIDGTIHGFGLGMLVSDFASGNMYVPYLELNGAIAKIAPDGTVLAQTSVLISSGGGQEMLLDGNKLFVPGGDRALVFDADTLARTN